MFMKYAGNNRRSPSSLCMLYTRQGGDVSMLVFREFVLDPKRLQSLALHKHLKISQTPSNLCSWLYDMKVEHMAEFA